MNRRASSYVNPAYTHDDGVTPEFRRPSNCSRSKSKNLTFWEKVMQQRMDAWKPVYEPYSLLAFQFFISVLFVIIGCIMTKEIGRVLEFEEKYTFNVTPKVDDNETMIPVEFSIPSDIFEDVIIMYRIKNFYQNSRFYEDDSSYDAIGRAGECTNESLSRIEDGFFGRIEKLKREAFEYFEKRIWYLPVVNKRCGTGMDFMYQDEFQLKKDDDVVPLTDTNITQILDKNFYENPRAIKDNPDTTLWKNAFDKCELILSDCWKIPIYKLDLKNLANNGLQNSDYLVWKRRAAFSTFIKPYRRLDKIGNFKKGLPAGNYTIFGTIRTTFVSDLKIEKQVFITVTSWLGIRNLWFGKMYLAVGIIGLILTALLTFTHIKFGKTLDQKCNDNLPIVFG